MLKIFKTLTYIFAIIGLVLVLGYVALELGLTKSSGVVDNQHDYFKNIVNDVWINSDEWSILKQAILKDKDDIDRVSREVGISSRIIVTPLVVEQLRLFNSEREIFKQIFAPLKILGNQSQFSWGVMGIKQETAKRIESNLKDVNSNWYLGKEYESMLDFKTDNTSNERFERLTSEDNRYYSYLYAALYLKEISNQWKIEGFDISDKPDILATLYNIGFDNSKPKSNPRSGGAEIQIGDMIYSFGSLANSFYNSNELIDVFPRND